MKRVTLKCIVFWTLIGRRDVFPCIYCMSACGAEMFYEANMNKKLGVALSLLCIICFVSRMVI